MTNEEIVARIQAGEGELVGKLWEQVEWFVSWKARRVINAIDRKGGVVFDDLYNSGFLAMVAAIDTYDPESGAFTTWLMFYLKKEFAEATGIRTRKSRNDPLRNAMSLSSPVGDDDDSGELIDIIPDPAGAKEIEATENRIWYEQLRQVVAEALEEIPTEQSEVIRHRYIEGKTLATIGKEIGITAEDVRKLEGKGLRALRQHRISRNLRPFYDFDYYAGAGLQTFRRTGTSIQERYLLREEAGEERRMEYQEKQRRRSEQKAMQVDKLPEELGVF